MKKIAITILIVIAIYFAFDLLFHPDRQEEEEPPENIIVLEPSNTTFSEILLTLDEKNTLIPSDVNPELCNANHIPKEYITLIKISESISVNNSFGSSISFQ